MARDLIHDAIKHALQRNGWKIVADPFRIVYAEFVLLADLAANPPDQVERRKLIVEVKSFAGRSFVKELQQALGQYVMYRDFIELNHLDYVSIWQSVKSATTISLANKLHGLSSSDTK